MPGVERASPVYPQVYTAPIWKCVFDVQLLPQSERRIRHDLVRHCVLIGADSLLRAECWRLQVLHDRSKQAMGLLRSSTTTDRAGYCHTHQSAGDGRSRRTSCRSESL